MNYLSEYETATGRIKRVMFMPEASIAEQRPEPGHAFVSGEFDGKLYYVADGEAVPRQPLPGTWNTLTVVADGESLAQLSGLPIPCTVYVDGEPHEVDDGSFELLPTTPGAYSVRIDHPAYLPVSWTVYAN